jgi:hypothetical protein
VLSYSEQFGGRFPDKYSFADTTSDFLSQYKIGQHIAH